jgi:Ca2+:H+ antiporter
VHNIESLSEEIAAILAAIYLLSLVFSLRTHWHLFAGAEEELPATGEQRQPEWNRHSRRVAQRQLDHGS